LTKVWSPLNGRPRLCFRDDMQNAKTKMRGSRVLRKIETIPADLFGSFVALHHEEVRRRASSSQQSLPLLYKSSIVRCSSTFHRTHCIMNFFGGQQEPQGPDPVFAAKTEMEMYTGSSALLSCLAAQRQTCHLSDLLIPPPSHANRPIQQNCVVLFQQVCLSQTPRS